MAQAASSFAQSDWDALTDRQRFFVAEYIVDFNATRAARAAGYKQPQNECVRLLNNTKIAQAVEYVIKQREIRTFIRADDVLKRWFLLATADPSELIEYRVEACRHCWGVEHRYQWNETEFKFACEEYDAKRIKAEEEGRVFKDPPPDERGGFGWRPDRKPHPECPKCDGRGIERTVIKPTEDLSPQAKILYAGMKQTRDGVQVLMHDQAKALEMVARHLGMLQPENPTAVFNNTIQNANVSGEKEVRRIVRRIVQAPVQAEEQDQTDE